MTHNNEFKASSKFASLWDAVVMLLIFAVANTVVGAAFAMWGVMPTEGSDVETVVDSQVQRGIVIAVMYLCAMLLTLVGVAAYRHGRGARGRIMGFAVRGLSPDRVLGGFLGIIALQIVVEPLTALLPSADVDMGRGLGACLSVVVAAPILEELLCRGYILGSLRTRYGEWRAVIFSALFFGVMHVYPASVVSATAAGLLLGYIYVRSNSLWLSMTVHALNNAVAFTLINYGFDNQYTWQLLGGGWLYVSVYIVASTITIIFFIRALRYFRRQLRTKKEGSGSNNIAA